MGPGHCGGSPPRHGSRAVPSRRPAWRRPGRLRRRKRRRPCLWRRMVDDPGENGPAEGGQGGRIRGGHAPAAKGPHRRAGLRRGSLWWRTSRSLGGGGSAGALLAAVRGRRWGRPDGTDGWGRPDEAAAGKRGGDVGEVVCALFGNEADSLSWPGGSLYPRGQALVPGGPGLLVGPARPGHGNPRDPVFVGRGCLAPAGAGGCVTGICLHP